MVLLSLVISGVLAVSCDENETSLQIVEQQHAVLDDKDSANSGTENDAIEPEEEASDAPDINISASWVAEDADKAAVSRNGLSLRVENHWDDVAKTKVEVVFGGLMTESISLDMGEVEIPALQEVYLDIPNQEIPLQTTKCVCSAIAFVTATWVTNGIPWNDRGSTDQLYYRQLPNYKGVKVFKEKVFLRDFGGQFVSLDNLVPDRANVPDLSVVSMGRVKRNPNAAKFTEVRFPKRGPDAPRLIGMGMGVYLLDEIGLGIEEEVKND